MEECYSGDNLYLILSEDYPMIKSSTYPKSELIFMKDLPSIDFARIDAVIFHSLSIAKAKLLKKIPMNIPIACSIWGGDFYNFLPEFSRNIYSCQTKEYLKQTSKWPWLFHILKEIFYFPVSNNFILWKDVVKRSELFSTVIPYEKSQVEKYFSLNSKYLPFPIYSLEKVIHTDDHKNTVISKENFQKKIFVGNSGHPTNNHLDILNLIKEFDNEKINVYVPLSYGNREYIKHICAIGNSYFGKRFHPLLNHLNLQDYSDLMNRMNIFVFNSYRQQGIGTIVQAFWSGGKVFLSNNNITSSYYKDQGLNFFSIEDDLSKTDTQSLFDPLTKDRIILNRERLLDLYSKEVVNNAIKLFISKLKEHKYNR